MKVLIIGAGNMGLTYGQSFVDASVVSPEDLYFLDRSDARSEALKGISGHDLRMQAGEELAQMDLIVLAVKPQDFSELAQQVKPFLRRDHLLLSIMAGITLDSLCQALGVAKVVRAMPNLPAQVGQGMTVFTTTAEVSRVEIFAVQNLLNTTGKTLHTDAEPMLDAATAVSGSGPAYVYYFMNAMMEAAKQMGFSAPEAQLLVRQTFLGSVNLLTRNSLHAQEWISRVSSKGGTTEAALARYDADQLDRLIAEGMEAARQRAIFLSGKVSQELKAEDA
jgi:pyrroline-5-carboxylate reductase